MDMTPKMLAEILNEVLSPHTEAIEKLDSVLREVQLRVPLLAEYSNEVRLEKVLEYESSVQAMRSLLDQIGGEMDEVMG